MEMRPTLEDVARAAGVGKTTASLALRHHPKIPEVTRLKVLQAAEQIHYRPDPALSRIAAYRWRSHPHPLDSTVAFVTNDHPALQRELADDMRRAAVEQGEQLGYCVEHFRLEDYPKPGQLARVLYHRGIRGIVVGQIFCDGFVRDFPWASFAAIGAHVGYFQPPVSVVVPDFLHTMVRVWGEALRAGYRRIGVALLKEFQAVDLLEKVSAALFCQTQLEPASQVIPVRHFPREDRTEFAAWMRRYQPEIVIGFNDSVFRWLQEAGYRVPDEVAYISLMLEQCMDAEKGISGMKTDLVLIGRIAIEQLDMLLRINRIGVPERPIIVQVPGEWHPGNTLARQTAPAIMTLPTASLPPGSVSSVIGAFCCCATSFW